MDVPESQPTPPPSSQISVSDGIAYWSRQSSTVDGMLGGFPQVSRIDLQGSLNFIAKLRHSSTSTSTATTTTASSNYNTKSPPTTALPPLTRAVDCGAGIGRITRGALSKVAQVVDVVEPVAKFAAEAELLRDAIDARSGKRLLGSAALGTVDVCALQDWTPRARYDLVWVQWCLGHLKDAEVLEFLGRCRGVLGSAEGVDWEEERGWVVVKENVSTEGGGLEDVFDAVDSTVTRADRSYRALFERAGMRVVRSEVQRGFLPELYPVRFYALRAK